MNKDLHKVGYSEESKDRHIVAICDKCPYVIYTYEDLQNLKISGINYLCPKCGEYMRD